MQVLAAAQGSLPAWLCGGESQPARIGLSLDMKPNEIGSHPVNPKRASRSRNAFAAPRYVTQMDGARGGYLLATERIAELGSPNTFTG